MDETIGNMPTLSRRLASWTETWLWPPLFVGALWFCLVYHEASLEVLPKYSWFLGGPVSSASSVEIWKVAAACTTAEAWQLGHVAARLASEEISESEATAAATALLSPFWCGTKGDKRVCAELAALMFPDQLLQMGDYFKQTGKLGAGELQGILSFGDLVWSVGALGVAAAFIPTLFFLGGSIMEVLIVVHRISQPLYGLFFYTLSLYIILCAKRYPHDPAALIALAGGTMAMATYTFLCRLRQVRNETTFLTALCSPWMLGLGIFTSLTFAYQSTILGLSTSLCLVVTLALHWFPLIMHLLLDLPARTSMFHLAMASSSITLLLLLLRLCEILDVDVDLPEFMSLLELKSWHDFLAPFLPGFACCGNIVLLLSGLVWCSRQYNGCYRHTFTMKGAASRAWMTYFYLNTLYAFILVIITGAGLQLMDVIFLNAGVAFTVLWMAEKLTECINLKKYVWVAVLTFSAALVCCGHYLSRHPELVVSTLGVERLAGNAAQEAAVSLGMENNSLTGLP